jgi:hypothetical protein
MKQTRPRRTKADREAAIKAALRKRLIDMMQGAHGPHELNPDTTDCPGVSAELGIEVFARYIGAIRMSFFSGAGREKQLWQTDLASLHHYDTLDGAVDYLYGIGVRP